jgi:endonuclease YncB( thermonuclease family)
VRTAMIALGLSLSVVGSSWAQQAVVGVATVVGSDTFKVNGTVYQVHGLDAVELQQSCYVDGQAWACGAAATRALQTLVDGATVSCTPTGGQNGNATFAVCTSQGLDVGETLVMDGWAVANPAQSDAYVAAEKMARAASVGIWRASFVPPSDFRADIAAIEKSYLQQASAAILADADKTLVAAPGVDLFPDVIVPNAGAKERAAMTAQTVLLRSLSPSFIENALGPREIFSWRSVARVLEDWRKSAVGTVVTGARGPIWAGLLSHEHRTERVKNESEYYEAMRRSSAQWIAQGRQPVLLTPQTIPGWVSQWFKSLPPKGAVITKKDGLAGKGYLGTIDGVDVYSGTPMPTDNSLLLPQDLLTGVSYGKNANGGILDLDPSSVSAFEMAFRFSISLEWKPDQVVWIYYPLEDHQ